MKSGSSTGPWVRQRCRFLPGAASDECLTWPHGVERRMADRRIRIRAPGGVILADLEDLLRSVGALEIALAPLELSARFAEDRPAYLEDRIEAWLHLVDRQGAAILETASGEGPFKPGWQAIYYGADVAGFRLRPPRCGALRRGDRHRSPRRLRQRPAS